MARQRIHTVMIQSAPRLDTLTALYLIRNTPEGERQYPGISRAKIVYWTTGTVSLDRKTWQQYYEEGVLLLGVGGSPLDEHPSPDFGDRKAQRMSTAMLVAQDLGLDQHPLYRRLVQIVTATDLGCSGDDPLGLSIIIKMMYRNGCGGRVINWTFTALNAFLDHQQMFLDAVNSAPDTDMREIERQDGRTYLVGLIRSDNEQCWAGVRHFFHKEQVAALVQVRSSGRVMVFGNQKLGVKLRRAAGAWRFHELCEQNRVQDARDYKDTLEQTGQMTLVPNICYQMPGENILNGSETAPGLDPTLVSPDFIRSLVCEYLEFADTAKETRQEELVA